MCFGTIIGVKQVCKYNSTLEASQDTRFGDLLIRCLQDEQNSLATQSKIF